MNPQLLLQDLLRIGFANRQKQLDAGSPDLARAFLGV
jgi:hypothetical protein